MAQLKDLLIIGPSLFNGDVAFSKIPTYNNIELALRSEIAYKNEGVYYVDGGSSSVEGTWLGTSDRITAYYDGLIINYKVGVAGHKDGTTLNINGLGAKPCYLRGTVVLGTEYPVGTMVLLSYNSAAGAFYSTDYDANSYSKVRQYKTSTDANYPILFSYSATENMPSSYDTNYIRKNATIFINPSTGALTAKSFINSDSSNSYVLLGGGGTKLVSDFEVANRCLPLAGSSLTDATNNMTGAIMFKDCDGIKINSNNKDVKVWEVYGNAGAYTSTYGFDLLYKGTDSGNSNSLSLNAHNQTDSHIEVFKILQDGTGNWYPTLNFVKQPTTTYKGTTQKLATENYVASAMNAAVVLRGTLGSGGTITSLPTASSSTLGDAYKVITAGTYASIAAQVGDMFICYQPTSSTYGWLLIPAGDDLDDSWRAIQVDGTQILGSGTSTGALNLKAGASIKLTATNGTVTIDASHPTYTFTDGTDSFTVTNSAGLNKTVSVLNRKIISKDDGSNKDVAPNRYSKYDPIEIPCGITYDFKHLDGISIDGQTNGPTGTYFGVMNWRSYGSATDYSGGPTLQLAYDMSGNLWKRIHKTDRTNNIFDWHNWVRLATTADLPTVNNNKVTITAGKGLSDGGSFTLNQGSDASITLNVGAGAGITVNNDTVALSASGVTAGTYGQESTKTLTYNDTFTIPVVTVDTYGRVTSANEYTLTMPGTDEFDKYIPLTGSSKVTGDITSSAKITATEFVGPATQLKTGRTLQVALGSTSASTTFNGTANVHNIGVSGTLAVGNGGTGQTSAINAANAFLNALTTGDSVPSDNDYYISQYVNGGTTHTTFHRRPVKHLYTYIKGKTDTVYVKLTGSSNITGDLTSSANIKAAKFVGPLDGTAAKATADADGNTISSTYLKRAGGIMTGALGLNSHYLIKPVAEYRTSTDVHNGMITIALPASIGNTMVSMWIDVYNYRANTSFSVHVGGYTYNNNTWQHHPFAMVYGANHKVRLGHNGTSFVIYVGETNSEWHYPQISVRDVVLGYSGSYTNWSNNWAISFTATEPTNVTATISDYVWTTKNFGPNNYIPLTGSSAITGDLTTTGKVTAAQGFVGDLNGNAATATALTSNAGAVNNPIYFVNGKPAATIWTVGSKDYGEHNCNNVTYSFSGYYTSNGPATSLGATTNDGSLWAQAYNDIWVTQIAQDYRDGALFVRGKNNGTWKPWLAVLDSSNFHSFLKDTYVNVTGDTMTGDLQMGSNTIHSKYYKITDGSTDKATYQYNSTDDCIELVFA